jgi:hypothetical protein
LNLKPKSPAAFVRLRVKEIIMSMNIDIAAARIVREMPATEASLDDALISVSLLIKTLVQARRDTGVAASTGQASIIRLAKAQLSLVTISNDVLRVHKELAKIGEVHAGMDLHEDCKGNLSEIDNVAQLSIAS